MWDLSRLWMETTCPALAGGFFTTAPPGKPRIHFHWVCSVVPGSGDSEQNKEASPLWSLYQIHTHTHTHSSIDKCMVIKKYRVMTGVVFQTQRWEGLSSSDAQPCLTLCDPMDCSMPGFPDHHQLEEFAQTHVHWVSDAIQPSHLLSSPSPPAFNLS